MPRAITGLLCTCLVPVHNECRVRLLGSYEPVLFPCMTNAACDYWALMYPSCSRAWRIPRVITELLCTRLVPVHDEYRARLLSSYVPVLFPCMTNTVPDYWALMYPSCSLAWRIPRLISELLCTRLVPVHDECRAWLLSSFLPVLLPCMTNSARDYWAFPGAYPVPVCRFTRAEL
jgi:hypothetical protein